MKDVTLNSRKTLRARGVAAYYGIGVSTVWRWAKEGKLPKVPASAPALQYGELKTWKGCSTRPPRGRSHECPQNL